MLEDHRMSDKTTLIITKEDEYRCAIANINNLKEVLCGADLSYLSIEEQNNWYASLRIIHNHYKELQDNRNQDSANSR
jgi:hypothetical protein